VSASLSATHRILIGGFASGCLAVLVIGYLLEPSARGMGSHTRLGLPACGWLAMFGKPCMTCGYTTTFALMTKGEFVMAFRNQPAAALLAIGTSAAFWLCAYAAITGSNITRVTAIFAKGWVLWTIGGMVMAAWGYKVWMHA
jgi:hypothetical protein